MTDATVLVKLFAFAVFVTAGVITSRALKIIRFSGHSPSLWLLRGLYLGDGLSIAGAAVVLGWLKWSAGQDGLYVLIITTWIVLPGLALSVAMCGLGVISKSNKGEQ